MQSRVKLQAVYADRRFTRGSANKAVAGGEDDKVRTRDQIDVPAHSGPRRPQSIRVSFTGSPGFPHPLLAEQADGISTPQYHNDNKRPQLKAGGGSGPPNTDRVGKRISSSLVSGLLSESGTVSVAPPIR